MYYIYNGKILNKHDKSKIKPYIDGIMYGYGLFETIKVENGRPLLLENHLKRLREGLEYFNINLIYSDKKIKKFINKLIKKNGFNGALKLTVIKNRDISNLIILMNRKKYDKSDYEKGFKLKTSSVLRNTTSKINKYKTLNYLENLLELKNAKNNGYDEVLFFNDHGNIAEGSISNIFFIKDEIVYTPGVDSGILNGIMRQEVIRIMDNLDIEYKIKDIPREFINECDAIFITNSLMEVMPVVNIESFKYSLSKRVTLRKIIENLYKEGWE